MIALLMAGVLALASPAPGCRGADISVTDLTIKVVKGSVKLGTSDRVLITANFTNIGASPQIANTNQHGELLRAGQVIAEQPLPALGMGVTYPLQFRIFRDISQRKDPIDVLVRYVLDDKANSAKNNCSFANDSLQKTF